MTEADDRDDPVYRPLPQRWNNSNKFLDNLHKAGDRPNRPLVFLGKT